MLRSALRCVALVACVGGEARFKDPRDRPECRDVYGARGLHSVTTVEDVISGRGPEDARPLYECRIKSPYGRFVDALDGGPPVFFLEIPKTGSTTIKSWLHAEYAENKRNARFDVRQSFTVVREPLARFLSGYGTVRHRGERYWPFNETRFSEAEKFERFVVMLSAEGDRLATQRPKDRCLWYHAFSQMWYFEFLPQRKVNYVLRLETLEADLEHMLRAMPLVAKNATLLPELPPRKNTREGNFDSTELRAASPGGIRKAMAYLKQDYACLGYPPADPP